MSSQSPPRRWSEHSGNHLPGRLQKPYNARFDQFVLGIVASPLLHGARAWQSTILAGINVPFPVSTPWLGNGKRTKFNCFQTWNLDAKPNVFDLIMKERMETKPVIPIAFDSCPIYTIFPPRKRMRMRVVFGGGALLPRT